MAESDPDVPTLNEVRAADGTRLVEALGPWTLRGLLAQPQAKDLARRARGRKGWDLRQASLDAAGAGVLREAWGNSLPTPLLLAEGQERFFARPEAPPAPAPEAAPPPPTRRFLEALGRPVLYFVDHLLGALTMVGQLTLDVLGLLRRADRPPWLEFSANVYRTGAQALGITALVGFLIGVVLSYLSTKQLRAFGADVYIVNILGISIIRELGPVLAAILVAGRSGSAMTAQLGVMRVTQELDALSVMGIRHSLRLVWPKVAALSLSLPLIVLWTDAMALLGGASAAAVQVNLGLGYFFTRLPSTVPTANVWLGMGKAWVFGAAIGIIACHFGLRVKPNTQSLGAGTTSSVVTSITAVILIDAVFAIVFSDVGITV